MNQSRSGRVSKAQLMKLLEVVSIDGVLMEAKVLYKYTNKRMFWKSVANELNAVDNTVTKPYYKWWKVFVDWKAKTKKKADNALKRRFSNQGPNFTKLELRLLKAMKYPIDDLLSHLNSIKANDKEQEHSIKFEADSEEYVNNPIDTSKVADDVDNTEFILFKQEDRKNSGYISDSENIVVKNEAEAAHLTMEDSTVRHRGNTLDDKFEPRHALEKERTHQNIEDLKLKSLELKLKADELRIKETELNKVNYLTQIEEEKLKYMLDIAASLKELVSWTKSGSSR